jgi:hypothetical protein
MLDLTRMTGSESARCNAVNCRFAGEARVDAPSYHTLNRRLSFYAKDSWRRGLAAARAGWRVGSASLVLCDISLRTSRLVGVLASLQPRYNRNPQQTCSW